MFSQPFIDVRTNDGRNVATLSEFTYTCADGTVIVVPAGTTSDGASTPRELWITIPPFGKYWMAAVLHDYLYRDTQLPKARCDAILLEAMRSLGVPEFEAGAIYGGVHFGGEASFEEDRKALTHS